MASESKAAALRSKSSDELNEELVALREEEFKMRMQRGTGQLSNTARFKQIRREVARIKTVQNEQAKKVVKSQVAESQTAESKEK